MRIAISDSHLRALVNGQQPKLHTFVRICERLGEKPEDVLAKLNDFGDRK